MAGDERGAGCTTIDVPENRQERDRGTAVASPPQERGTPGAEAGEGSSFVSVG